MQLSLDPAQEMSDLTITIRRGREGKHLFCAVVVANERGTVLRRWSKRSTRPRDESGLADWAKNVVHAYLYGDPTSVELSAGVSWLRDLPRLPSSLA